MMLNEKERDVETEIRFSYEGKKYDCMVTSFWVNDSDEWIMDNMIIHTACDDEGNEMMNDDDFYYELSEHIAESMDAEINYRYNYE